MKFKVGDKVRITSDPTKIRGWNSRMRRHALGLTGVVRKDVSNGSIPFQVKTGNPLLNEGSGGWWYYPEQLTLMDIVPEDLFIL